MSVVPNLGKFDSLWLDPSFVIIATRKEINLFVENHVNLYGNVLIFVRGNGRYVKWKSIGAGMYRVYTTEEV
jgi:hypothetical protein